MLGLRRWPKWSTPLHTAQRTYKVEILKFAEPPKRNSRTQNKKRGGLMPLLAVVVSVAVVGGMSTTLAGTISLNGGSSVEFGQGVVTTAACDTSIDITPISAYQGSDSTFYIEKITLSKIGFETGTTLSNGLGCLNKKFTLKAYNQAGVEQNWDTGTAKSIFVNIPADTATAASNGFNTKTSWIGTELPSGWNATGGNQKTDSTGDVSGKFTITGLRLDPSTVRITLESSGV